MNVESVQKALSKLSYSSETYFNGSYNVRDFSESCYDKKHQRRNVKNL